MNDWSKGFVNLASDLIIRPRRWRRKCAYPPKSERGGGTLPRCPCIYKFQSVEFKRIWMSNMRMRCEPNLLLPHHITWPTPARAAEEGGVHARARPLALPPNTCLVSCLSLSPSQTTKPSRSESVNTEGKIARMVFVFVDGPL